MTAPASPWGRRRRYFRNLPAANGSRRRRAWVLAWRFAVQSSSRIKARSSPLTDRAAARGLPSHCRWGTLPRRPKSLWWPKSPWWPKRRSATMAEPQPVAILVEDERQIRRFVRTALEAEGWSVYESDTLRQGLIDSGTRKP